MTLFLPDLNVWLALADAGHAHSANAWQWLRQLPNGPRLIFSRYTQVGFLRLLTNKAVMGRQTLTLGAAWSAYDRWLADARVEFYPEPPGLDAAFRQATQPFAAQPASKAVGDCLLLAFASEIRATLVTFDRALKQLAQQQGCDAVIP